MTQYRVPTPTHRVNPPHDILLGLERERYRLHPLPYLEHVLDGVGLLAQLAHYDLVRLDDVIDHHSDLLGPHREQGLDDLLAFVHEVLLR